MFLFNLKNGNAQTLSQPSEQLVHVGRPLETPTVHLGREDSKKVKARDPGSARLTDTILELFESISLRRREMYSRVFLFNVAKCILVNVLLKGPSLGPYLEQTQWVWHWPRKPGHQRGLSSEAGGGQLSTAHPQEAFRCSSMPFCAWISNSNPLKGQVERPRTVLHSLTFRVIPGRACARPRFPPPP